MSLNNRFRVSSLIGALLIAGPSLTACDTQPTDTQPKGTTPTPSSTNQVDDPSTTPQPATSMDFEWTPAELPLPEGLRAHVVGMTGGPAGLIVFAQGFDQGAPTLEEARSLLVWQSTDGNSWRLPVTATGIPVNAQVDHVIQRDGGYTAVGMQTDPDHPLRMLPVVLSSADGMAWEEASVAFQASDDEDIWLGHIAAGNVGILIAMNASTRFTEPTLAIEKDGKTLVADPNEWTLQITDADGSVLYEGTPEQIWRGGESEFGFTIRDPETREVLFTIGWERLDRPDEETDDGSRVYLIDGYRLVMEDFGGSFTVEDVETGETILTGDEEEFYRGPPPLFTDAAGAEVMSLNWREVDRAMEAAWSDGGHEGEGDYSNRPALLHSTDGSSFFEVEIGDFVDVQEAHINSLLATGDGFTVFGELWSPAYHESRQLVWKSTDGNAWDAFQPADAAISALGGRIRRSLSRGR